MKETHAKRHTLLVRYTALVALAPYACMYIVVGAVGGWLYAHQANVICVEYAPALESIKLLKDWCAWLATISTASIGASAYLSTGAFAGRPRPAIAKVAVAAFASSLGCTATLLLSLPSLVLRLQLVSSVHNDVYELVAFLWLPDMLAPFLRIGFLAFAQYYFFLIGVMAFAINATRQGGSAKDDA